MKQMIKSRLKLAVKIFLIALIAVMFASEFHPAFMLFAIPLIALATGMIYTLKSRINEIRSGEEDDLSDY